MRRGEESKSLAFRQVLVPLSGDPDDEKLILGACRLAQLFKAKLTAVHVIEVPMSLPVDAPDIQEAEQAERILDRAEELASPTELETVILQAREAGPAIIEQALDSGADLIFMGVHIRRRLGVTSLGRTATYVLQQAPCTVWVSKWAHEETEKTP
jgi:nucleotide-binding universal stress UspA family protein